MLQPQRLTAKAREYPGLRIDSIEGTVLATIINPKVEDVEHLKTSAKRRTPFRSLEKALKHGHGRSFILECKKSSPTLGDFAKDFSLDRLLSCYESRASAISVLCEEHFFKGPYEYLKYVRERTALPVLCKDFIICEAQLEAAVAAGADAVLLMLSLLTPERFLELYTKAREMGLEVLAEVDTREDALFAASRHLPVVGINNRNLRTLKVDLQKARELAPLFSKETAVVSESGINEHEDLCRLPQLRAFLIGSALSGSDDVFYKANTMLYGLNKLCGITDMAALDAAIKGHAAICGLIFAPKSPRCVSMDFARSAVKRGHPQTRFAAVFVDAAPEEIINTVKETGADYVQLHGHEDAAYIEKIRKALPGTGIIKAVACTDAKSAAAVRDYLKLCDLVLCDSQAPGSGRSFDWSIIPADADKKRILLSGGIGIANLKEALAQGFAGVDMNSALEKVKGAKDPELVEEAFGIIKDFI